MRLCADIGGTKALVGLAERDALGRVKLVFVRRHLVAQHADFAALLRDFLAEANQALGHAPWVDSACLGVAGPVVGRRVQMTNLPWLLDADAISQQLGGCPVTLVNDFCAAASGMDALDNTQLVCLQRAQAQERAPQLVIGAGSGLGIAFRFWNGQHYQVIPGEGGHMGFAPLDEEQDRLLHALRAGHARLVAEHVVSGPGLTHLYTALLTQHSPGRSPIGAPPSAEQIQQLARQGDPIALQAADHFLRCYGAVCGDMALATLARGGVFVAGGIALKWRGEMADGRFVRAFCAKGPYAEVMRSMPIHLVTEAQLGLLGAARLA